MITNTKETNTVKSKISIAENSCYGLSYDYSKNRIYSYIRGFWKNKETVSNYLKDWSKAIALTVPGFTVLSDLSSMITQPQELNALHMEVHSLLIEAGVLQVAQVNPIDRIATLQVNEIANKSKIPVKKFSSVEYAQEGLNQITSLNEIASLK